MPARSAIVDEATGILITGNSGAGKTSSAVEIAGMLTESAPAEVIVLDPHFNDQWQIAGLQAISRIEEIEQAIASLLQELDARHERKRLGLPNGRKVLVITDELLSCKKRFVNPKKVGDALSRLSTEGRKRDMLFLGISHSPNADDIDISAEVRTSFAVIKLCKSAQKHVSNFWEKSDPRKAYILNHPGYPAIVADGVDEIVDHPTHAHHPQFKKNGNQPKYQHKINQLSWTTLNLDGSWKASNLTSNDENNADCEDKFKPSGENIKGTQKSDIARKIDLAKPPEDEQNPPNISLEYLLNLVLEYAQQEGTITVRDVQTKKPIGRKYYLSSEAIVGIFTELENRRLGKKIEADSLGKICFVAFGHNPKSQNDCDPHKTL
jgi:hypothetical protein